MVLVCAVAGALIKQMQSDQSELFLSLSNDSGDHQDSIHDYDCDVCYPDDNKSQSELFLSPSNDCGDRVHDILSPGSSRFGS